VTAEIAIINRSAVTLASDSAMTLSVRGREKIYTSADKLFELCNADPIAIMVYNNLHFLGVPLELAIKRFREQKTGSSYKTVKDAADAFFDFIIKDLKHSDKTIAKHVKAVVCPVFALLRERFNESVLAAFQEFQKSTKKSKKPPTIHPIFLGHIAAATAYYQNDVIDGPIGTVPNDDIAAAYSDVIGDCIQDFFKDFPIDDGDTAKLTALAVAVVKSAKLSGSYSGLVFAGYGSEEMFPALHAFEVDGVVSGHVKKKLKKEFVASVDNDSSEIIPFAQREMVDRFLFGIDSKFTNSVDRFFGNLLRQNGELIIDESTRSKAKRKDLRQKLNDAIQTSLKSLRDDFIPAAKKKNKDEIEDMVLFMAKPELASLAEALVNITSVKRKFSAEQETVAGPIDVAVVSKTDGFVWVRRKHYFTPELNPRYFWRKYKTGE
jgi:hypothetical protein